MIIVIVLALAMLLALSYYWTRTVLAPATLYSAVWFASISGLALAGDSMYPVSDQTLFLYFVGAVAFNAGALFADACFPPGRRCAVAQPRIRRRLFYLVLDLTLATVVLGLPAYLMNLVGKVGIDDPAYYFAAIRRSAIEASDETTTFSVVRNLSVVALLLAMTMHYESNGTAGRRWRAYLAIGIALIYGVADGTKGNAVVLILMLLFISWIKAGRMNPRQLIIGGAAALAIFSAGLLAVNYAYMDTGNFAESSRFLFPVLQDYWLGGLVAFDRVMRAPHSIEAVQSVSRFLLETANSLGVGPAVPSRHAEFTDISAAMDSNVYTIYYTYFLDFGWLGSVLWLATLGGLSTWIFRFALRGVPIAVMLYAIVAKGIVLSVQAEHFFLTLNFMLKAVIFFCLLYLVVARMAPATWRPGRPNHA